MMNLKHNQTNLKKLHKPYTPVPLGQEYMYALVGFHL